MGDVLGKVANVATLGIIPAKALGGNPGKDAANAAIDASNIAANAQLQGLNYLKQQEALPTQFRNEALPYMAAAYGLPSSVSSDQFLQNAQNSPIYQAIMGSAPQMEEAVLRNQSATGALRTGATDQMIANSQRLLRGQALQGVMGGIQSLAQTPSAATQIAQMTGNIGSTQAAGITAAAQAQQQAQQNSTNNLMGLGNMAMMAAMAFCDPRLKSNARKIGEKDGFQIYEWEWNDKAAELGLHGKEKGPMADEIIRFMPERIVNVNGYMCVRAA
jgi:hypothetical protein